MKLKNKKDSTIKTSLKDILGILEIRYEIYSMLGATECSTIEHVLWNKITLCYKDRIKYLNPINDMYYYIPIVESAFKRNESIILIGKDCAKLLERIKNPCKFERENIFWLPLTIWMRGLDSESIKNHSYTDINLLYYHGLFQQSFSCASIKHYWREDVKMEIVNSFEWLYIDKLHNNIKIIEHYDPFHKSSNYLDMDYGKMNNSVKDGALVTKHTDNDICSYSCTYINISKDPLSIMEVRHNGLYLHRETIMVLICRYIDNGGPDYDPEKYNSHGRTGDLIKMYGPQ